MTDEQIIKALKCCATDDGDDCSQCPYGNIVYKPGNGGCVNRCRKDALDLINRQKAENERLRAELDKYPVKTLFANNSVICSKTSEDYDKLIMDISNNAIKEFAERLKSISIGLEIGDDKKIKVMAVSTIAIDKIAKEMTEVKENEK